MEIVCASMCWSHVAEDQIAATLERCPKIGYRFMEINGSMTADVQVLDAVDVPGFRRRLEASGMRCTGMYSAGWGGRDEQKVRRNATQLAKAATVVEALGGDHVTTSGDGRQGDAGGLDRVIACAQLVVEQLPPECGVKLTMEPHYGNILMYPEDFSTVMDAVADPRIGICIDTGHFHRAGVDTVAFIRRFARRIHGAHFKDVLGSRAVGIGRGEIDLGRSSLPSKKWATKATSTWSWRSRTTRTSLATLRRRTFTSAVC